MPIRPALALTLLALLSGCELLGIESPERIAALKEGEGKAVGSACRHAQRALEDCYALNPKAQKAAVYAGWLEMDGYMRENKIDGIAPTLVQGSARALPPAAERKSATPAKQAPES